VNVVLYVVDALRADHLSCYGYDRETTPTIDALAAEGVRYERCFTPATWTRPVAATLSTGLYPPAHGARTREDVLSMTVETLAERFRAAGFETVGITAMGNVSTATGFDRGFDRFRDLYREESVIEKRGTSTAADEELAAEEGVVALPRAEDITDAFETWLADRDGADPFFAFCWSIEPHVPYDPPAGHERFRDSDYGGPVDGSRESLKHVETDVDLAALQARYDEEIRYNDECIGDLVDVLRAAGEFEDTLFCVVGDHGDAFEEHGRLTHGHAPYDELVRVPWVARPPGGVDERVVTELASLVDVYPTLLDAASVDVPERPEGVAGRSRALDLAGSEVSVPGHDRVYFETQSYDMQNAFYGVRTPDWKYIRIERPEMGASTAFGLARYVIEQGLLLDILRHPRHYWNRYRYDDTERLYDLEADPAEETNLVGDRDDRADDLAAALEEWLDVCRAFRGDGDDERADIDAQTKDQLRELGYAE
jgi:arylsulfatase A-like enzyme